MKKTSILLLMLLLSFLIPTKDLQASPISYTYNTETTHTFQTFDLNKTIITVDDILVFDKGQILDNQYSFIFNTMTSTYEEPANQAAIIHTSTNSTVSLTYSNSTHYKSRGGTHFTNKTVTFTIDDSIDVIDPYYQVMIKGYNVILFNAIVQEGYVLQKPENDPTRSGYDFIYWHNAYDPGYEYNFNQPILYHTFIEAHFVPSTVPTWEYNATYGSSDYLYEYLTSSDTTHTLSTPNLNYLTLYADGNLIYDRGQNINESLYMISSGIGVEFQIQDVVNTKSAIYYSNGSISSNITSFSNLIVVYSLSPQNIYVFDTETMHPFHDINSIEFDIYRNKETVLKDTNHNPLYQIAYLFGGITVTLKGELQSTTFSNQKNLHNPYVISRTNDTGVYTFIYRTNQESLFKQDTTFVQDDVTITIKDGQTIELTAIDQNPKSFTTLDLKPYIANLQVGKAYKITYDAVYSDLQHGGTTAIFYPFYINSKANVKLYTSAAYHVKSFVFVYTADTSFKIKLDNVVFRNVQTMVYNLYIQEVLAHTVEFEVPTQLNYRQSRIAYMNRVLTDHPLEPQTVEHYTPAINPRDNFEDYTNGNYTIIGYYDENGSSYDFDAPVVNDILLNPVIVPNYGFSLIYDSNGGSDVSVQHYFPNDPLVQPTSPIKTGYTFDGWYVNLDIPFMIDTPITELNNHSLREVFESSIPALENLVTNGDFSDGTTGYVSDGTTGYVSSKSTTVITNNNAINTADGTTILGTLSFETIAPLNNNDIWYFKTRTRVTNTLATSLGVFYNGTNNATTVLVKDINRQTLPVQNQWYVVSKGISVSTSDGNTGNLRLLFAHYYTNTTNATNAIMEVDYAMAFNLTASFGVTATSGTAYDNAVAEIEWLLSKNDGYIESVGNPFEIVDLSVEQMDYWYSVYQDILNGEIEIDESYVLFDFNQQITQDSILFAKWIPNPPGTFTVTFNAQQGSYVAPINIEENTLVTRPSDPYRQGYNFKGWSQQPGGELWDFTTDVLTDDLTLYAVWELPPVVTPTTPIDNDIFLYFVEYWYIIIPIIGGAMLLLGFGYNKKKGSRRRWR